MLHPRPMIFLAAACLVVAANSSAQGQRDATSSAGMVVSISPDASEVGADVLARGGNAVDAAIATAFALAVTHPSAGNIGGGGFMLVHPSDGSPPLFIDYREKAPLSSTVDMYVDGGSRKSHRFVGVPGTVHGLSLAHEIYGSMGWAELVEPAVRLARDGFTIHASLARSLNLTLLSSQNDEFKRVYGRGDGKAWEAGQRLVLTDLGETLARIRDGRTEGFYAGRTAQLLAAEMERGGGYISLEDLARYRARVRTPIQFRYRGHDVLSAPPPSSGGITLAQAMQMLEPFELRNLGRWSPGANHLIIEAMRRAYAERAAHLGDADFVDIDQELWTPEYARGLAKSIDPRRATPSAKIGPPLTLAKESEETTHFSVMDGSGMAVSNTYTLEAGYGSGVVVRGAGFLLNNEMGDFNPEPGVTSENGRIGTAANLIEPEKRMLSSMTPTIVTKDGKVVLVTGSPGGRTIINTVLCVTLNVLEFEMGIREAVDAARMDHEWFPDRVRFMGADGEHGALAEKLRAMGHEVRSTRGQGDANSILVDSAGAMQGAADDEYGAAVAPRLREAAAVECDLDLSSAGKMSDILSNALMRGLDVKGARVLEFLDGVRGTYATGDRLLEAAAEHFGIEEGALRAQVNAFHHVNCDHGPVGGADNGVRDRRSGGEPEAAAPGAVSMEGAVEVSPFARNVMLHVVLHELAHALVREFDLPVLGNEETLADAFATHYLTTYLPERAEATLLARVQSLMIEAGEIPRADWTVAGEHNSDARRAFQIAALSVAADREKYAAVAAAAGMSEDDVQRAADYGTEIHRSWRRILAPFWIPAGMRSGEARLTYEETPLFLSLFQDDLDDELRRVLQGFDWHSQVTIAFQEGEGGAAWNRSKRTVTVKSAYVRRFMGQGVLIQEAASEALRPRERVGSPR